MNIFYFEMECDYKMNIERIWKELAKDGIYNEKQLDEAIKKMKLLNIGGFVNPIPKINK